MLARTALLQAMLFESDFKHAESFLISLGIESVGIYKKLATGACCPEDTSIFVKLGLKNAILLEFHPFLAGHSLTKLFGSGRKQIKGFF